MISISVNNAEFRKKLASRKKSIVEKAVRLVEVSTREGVNYAKSKTGETVPGASVNAAGNYVPVAERRPRKAHPGGWADITGNLANSIQQGEITISTNMVKGTFGVLADIDGSMEYAEIMDHRDGIEVLGGADVAVKKALKKYGKEVLQ